VPKFNLRDHNPAPANIRQIIASKGLSNAKAAKAINVSKRTIDAWTSETDSNARRPHYVWQFALESIPASSTPSSNSPQSKTAAQEP
jgi:DNA-binding XRE family transcriptional regulator